MSTDGTVEVPVSEQVEGAMPELGDAGRRALEAERAARKAAEDERKALAARLKEFEDRDKTETQRQAERVVELERENARLVLDKTRVEVAAVKGVPVGLLHGDDREGLEAYADAVLAFAESLVPAGSEPQRVVVPAEGKASVALNGDGIEVTLRDALGIR